MFPISKKNNNKKPSDSNIGKEKQTWKTRYSKEVLYEAQNAQQMDRTPFLVTSQEINRQPE